MAPRQIGQYQLIKLLANSKASEVHRARHKKSKEMVAIKLLHEFVMDQQSKQRFMREAKLVERLNHPGIVQILGADFYRRTRPYIVMSYAPGGTLRKRYPSGTPLPLETVLSYTRQLADALGYAHQHNIVHCDLKPENILLDKDDRLLLSDFGSAQIREAPLSQTTRDAFGTALYMAPEQFRGKYSPATDQYALATMVYEWLCGRPPFSGNHNQLMDRHMSMPVPSLKEACIGKRDISENVEQVILKALAKEPSARFSSIQEFALALEQTSQQQDAPSPIESSVSFPPSSPLSTTITSVVTGESMEVLAPLETIPMSQGESLHMPATIESVSALGLSQPVSLPITLFPKHALPPQLGRKRISRSPAFLLVGLAVFVMLGSVGLMMATMQISVQHAQATSGSARN